MLRGRILVNLLFFMIASVGSALYKGRRRNFSSVTRVARSAVESDLQRTRAIVRLLSVCLKFCGDQWLRRIFPSEDDEF